MVVKPRLEQAYKNEFESSVIPYGSKIELVHAINVKLAKKFNWKYRRGKI